ncbi:bifunctional 3-(3-hydroxy-phenyl)propionate/3-hydroxycinnamic acid hydroxylase [Pseudonocardia sp. ICBG1122]|nr:bifunctional 3-(3-hydroxy-phenyl)propionate/3-hydroxycinnamic acid hydroxylase [Pseudonocardia pini]
MDEHVDVAIVGGGPVGMVLAALLAGDGIRTLVLEREQEIGHRPRARHLDGEAMRVLQTIGVAGRCEQVMPVFGGGLRLVDAGGRTLTELPFDATRRGPQGWFDDYQLSQPLLLDVLRGHLEGSGSGAVRTGHEVTALDQGEDHVRIDTVDPATGARSSVTASWVVGCDGAGSAVRSLLGTRFRRLGPDHPFLVVDATPGPTGYRVPDPAYSRLVCDPARPHYVSPGNGPVPTRLEFMVLPGDDPAELVTPAGIARLTAPYLDLADTRVDRAAVYVFHSLLVDRWRTGRVLLAGDAAHVQPPFMGQGLCSGVRDASNLAWKLAAVCRGESGDELLDTYGAERSVHARHWIDEANRIGAIVMTTDPAEASALAERLLSGDRAALRPLSPRLGPSPLCDGPAAGALAPQPVDEDGRLLDDVVGRRFVVAASQAALAGLGHEVRSDPRVAVLAPRSPATRALLADRDADAVVVRPDRYVLGAAHGPDGLADLIRRIPSVTSDSRPYGTSSPV